MVFIPVFRSFRHIFRSTNLSIYPSNGIFLNYGTETLKSKSEVSLTNQYLECYIKIIRRKPDIGIDILTQLQALDKFVNRGPCPGGNCPEKEEQAIQEWNAWKNIGKTISTDEAKTKYIQVARSCLKKFETEDS